MMQEPMDPLKKWLGIREKYLQLWELIQQPITWCRKYAGACNLCPLTKMDGMVCDHPESIWVKFLKSFKTTQDLMDSLIYKIQQGKQLESQMEAESRRAYS